MTTAFSLSFTACWRLMKSCTASVAEIFLVRISDASLVADMKIGSSFVSVEAIGAAFADDVMIVGATAATDIRPAARKKSPWIIPTSICSRPTPPPPTSPA